MRHFFLGSLLLLLSCDGLTQPDNYSILHYTAEEGLPQNSITGIAFDRAGYCWLGTELGLVRFDGVHFRTFNSATIKGLRSDRIRLLTMDSSGQVFGRNDQWQLLVVSDNDSFRSPSPQLLGKNQSPYWLVNGYVTHRALYPAERAELSANPYVARLKNGDTYCIVESQLRYGEANEFQSIYTIRDPNAEKWMPVDECFVLFDNAGLKIWKKGRLLPTRPIGGPLANNPSFKKGQFVCLDSYDQTYIYSGGTVYKIAIEDNRLMSEELLTGLRIPVISKIYYHAAEHRYYVGSLVDGLYIISESDFNYPAQPPQAAAEGFFVQALTSQGDIIRQRFLYRNGKQPVRLGVNRMVGASYYLNTRQQLYYGNEPALYRYDLKTGVNQKVLDLDTRPSSIYRDKTDSSAFIVTTTYCIEKIQDDTLKEIRRLTDGGAMLGSLQLGRDSFLLATENGVRWYDFVQNKVYKVLLDSINIRSLYPEENGNLWISTYGKGFYIYHEGRLIQLPTGGHKGLLTIHNFIDDRRGNFWLPTNNGLFVVRKKMLVDYADGKQDDVPYYMYSTRDKLRTNEFNGGCTPGYIWTSDSMLSLPSIAGFVTLRPDRARLQWPDKRIYVDELRVDNVPVNMPLERLELSPDFKRLFIRVSSPYFASRENMQLEYMLRGVDDDWRRVPESGEIELNRVSAGHYQLIVRKNPGADVEQYFLLAISVRPWFYNTWWFYLLVVIALLLITFGISRWRIKQFRDRNRRLKAIIEEQTGALVESNRTKDRIITMVLHDLRSPVRFLHTVTTMLAKDHEKGKRENMTQALELLQNSTAALDEFTEQFFTWATSQHQKFRVMNELFPLQPFLAQLADLYRDLAAGNGNRLEVAASSISVYTDRNILSVIIRNLLDNANKHTMNGTIRISADRNENRIVIAVADTGRGMSAAMQHRYFDKERAAAQNGNGSLIVLGLLEKIGGHLSIESEEGKGTTFRVELIVP